MPGASRASVITYINPVVATLLGVLVLDEHLGIGGFIAFALILLGSWLATRGKLSRSRARRGDGQRVNPSSYASLPERFFARVQPTPVAAAACSSNSIARSRADLDLDLAGLDAQALANLFSGNALPPGTGADRHGVCRTSVRAFCAATGRWPGDSDRRDRAIGRACDATFS